MTLTIDLKQLEQALAKIEHYLSSYAPQKAFKILLICEEMMTNLRQHANFQDNPPVITLSLNMIAQDQAELIITENAKPFDLLAFPKPDTTIPLKERQTGGLGLYLIKKYAQSIDYNYANGCNIYRIMV